MTLLFDYLTIPGIPRLVGFLHPIIFLIFFISSRVFAYYMIRKISSFDKQKNIIVYCNINKAEFLKNILRYYNILLFFTYDINFEKRLIGNIPIFTLTNLNKSISKKN